MKVLFLHAGAELYGADQILLELVKGLIKENVTVSVLVPEAGPLVAELEDAGAKVLIFEFGVLRRKYFSFFGMLNRAWYIAIGAGRVWRLIRRERFDLVHSNTSVVLAGAFAARLARIPHIWHIHEITTNPRFVAVGLAKLISRLSSRVVCVSHAVRRHLEALAPGIAPITAVIYNGIEPRKPRCNARQNIREQWGVSDQSVLIGMVGRVNAWKGQRALVRAFEQTATALDLRCVMVGGIFAGEEHILDALNTEIGRSVRPERYIVEGFRRDIPDVLSAFDVFVLPSTSPDPLPTVVLEAMHAGLPVVSFAHGGAMEMVVDEKTGFLCEVGSTLIMASKFNALAADPCMRAEFGLAGQQRVTELFTREAFLGHFTSLYEKAIADR
jgi:glycosyltransferase involved in cell wall biosynthesis